MDPHQCPRAWRAVWALAGIGKVGGGRQRPALDFIQQPKQVGPIITCTLWMRPWKRREVEQLA